MNLLDAARQALEALEYHVAQTRPIHQTGAAITALRQVIEQAEQQEPVGEIVQGFADLVAVLIPVMPPVGTKLYTTPPQRKPLTNEQLEAMAEVHVTNCYFDTLTYARAIERAHGIGGGE